MRRILLFVLIFIAIRSGAQSAASYCFRPFSGTYTALSGSTAVSSLSADEAYSSAIPLGFTFKFGGVDYTDVYASSNGFVSFESLSGAIPDNTVGVLQYSLYALWDDLSGASGTASYLTSGSSPNRVFTMEYKNWIWNTGGSSPSISFQVKLYETSNKIEYAYKQESGSVYSASATIGVGGVSGTNYRLLDGTGTAPGSTSTTFVSGLNAKPATGQIYEFTPTFAPTTTVAYYCIGAGPSAVSATKIIASDTLVWYTTPAGGTGTTTAPTPSTATAGNFNYYAVAKNALGCESQRTPARVKVIEKPAAPVIANQTVYNGQRTTAIAMRAADEGTVCGTIVEYDTLRMSAPLGTSFDSVIFASYGLPSGNCTSGFSVTSCHATTSVDVLNSIAVGTNSFKVAADNTYFYDDCYGSFKILAVVLRYKNEVRYDWTSSKSTVGIASSGSDTIPAFIAINNTNVPIIDTITVTPVFISHGMSCAGDPMSYTITINPVTKIHVDSTNGSDFNGGEAWGATHAMKTVSRALHYARNNQYVDSILVAKGTYYPTGIQSGTNLDTSFLIARGRLKLFGGYPAGGGTRSASANPVVLSGEIGNSTLTTDNSYHVVSVVGIPSSADSIVIDGFTIRKGNSSSATTNILNGLTTNRNTGGGLYLFQDSIGQKTAVVNCIIDSNNAHNGAGIWLDNSSPYFSQLNIDGNKCPTGLGGSISWAGNYTGLTYSGSARGGGLGMTNSSSPIMISCNITNNIGYFGCGVYSDGGDPKVNDCNISGNSGSFGIGAGWLNNAGNPTVINSIISNNTIPHMAAAWFNHTGTTTISNSIVSGNTAGYTSGGVHNNSGGTISLSSVLFTQNKANSTNTGGAILNLGTMTVRNSTLQGNTATGSGSVGGLCNNGGTATVSNTIIYGNTNASGSAGIEVKGGSVAATYSDVQSGYTGTGNINIDPLFVNSSNAIGADNIWRSTDDGLSLQHCSKAINSGNNAVLSASDSIDVAKLPRIVTTTVDMGAYEFQSLPSTRYYDTSRVAICSGDSTLFNGVYYKTAVTHTDSFYTSGGCDSFKILILKINTRPAAPTTAPVFYCQDASGATALTATGINLKWYNSSGTLLSGAPTPSTATAGTTTYFVSQTSIPADGSCESPKASLDVTINPLPSITGTLEVCVGKTTTLSGSATAHATTPWTSSNTAVATVSSSGVVTGVSGGIVNITYQNTNNCTITASVTVNALPAAPTVSTPVNYCEAATPTALSASGASGSTIKWYTTATGGTGSTTAPTPVTGTPSVTLYYATQTSATTGCESPRALIVNNVFPKPDSVAINALSATTFCAGDSVTLVAKASVKMESGLTPFFTAFGQSDGTKDCNCPKGYAAVGYRGQTGDILDRFFLYCKPISRTGVIGSGLDSTLATGGPGGGLNPAQIFSGSQLLVGATLTDAVFFGTYWLKSVSGFGQNQSYIKAFSDNLSSPTALTGVSGVNSTNRTGSLWAPDGYAFTGMKAGTSGYATSVAFRYTPIGAFEYNYSWSTGSTADQIVAKTGATYTLTVTNSLGCSAQASVPVTVNPLPSAPGTATVYYCQGATGAVPLTATGTNLKWYTAATGGSPLAGAPTPSTATAGSVTWYVSQTSDAAAGGCEGPRAAITVTISANPAAPTVTTPVAYCDGATALALSATGTNLKWYSASTGGTGSTTATIPATTPAGSTIYYVSQSLAAGVGGCESPRAAITVNVNPLPVAPTVTTPLNLCVGGPSSALTASGSSLKWYTVATGGTALGSAPTPSTGTAGTTNYYVSQTSAAGVGGCEGPRALLAVIVNALPAAPTVTSNYQLCQSAPSLTLSATGSNLKWYTAATGGTSSTTAPTVTTTALGTVTHYVSASLAASSGGCEGPRASITVRVNANPLAPTVVSPLNLCIGGPSVTLSATGTNIKWYTVATGGSGTSTAPVATTGTLGTTTWYVSQTTDATVGSCEGPRATQNVVVNPLPTVSISSLSPYGFIFCRGLSVTLKSVAPTATAWQWDKAGVSIPGATADTVKADSQTFWGLTVTDVKGCKNTAKVFVYKDSSVRSILSPATAVVCEEGSALMTCSPGFVTWKFQWFKDGLPLIPATIKENLKNTTGKGTYSVIVTNDFGCLDTTNASVVTNYPRPVKPVIINADPLLSVMAMYRHYQWYRNGTFLPWENGSAYTTPGPGKYFVQVTDSNGCTNESDTIEILAPNAIKNVAINANIKIYPNPTNDIVNIEAPIPVNIIVTDMVGKTILVQNNAKTIDLSNYADGTYVFRITDENGQLISVHKAQKVAR